MLDCQVYTHRRRRLRANHFSSPHACLNKNSQNALTLFRLALLQADIGVSSNTRPYFAAVDTSPCHSAILTASSFVASAADK
jgi:hypothetical protein